MIPSRTSFEKYISFETVFCLTLFFNVYSSLFYVFSLPETIVLVLLHGISLLLFLLIVYHHNLYSTNISIFLFIIYIIFIIYLLLTNIWSPSQSYATMKSVRLVVLSTWAIVPALFLISTSRERINRLFMQVFLIGVIAALGSISAFFGISDLLGSKRILNSRMIGAAIIVTIWWILYKDNFRQNRLTYFIIIILFTTGLLVNGSRGPFIATVCAILLLFYTNSKTMNMKNLIQKTSKMVLVLLAPIIFIISIFKKYGWNPETLTRLARFTSEDAVDTSLNERILFYNESFDIWMHSPVFGHGIGSWPIMTGRGDSMGYPHNIILELLVEGGAISMLIFLTLIMASIYFTMPVGKGEKPETNLIFVLFVFILINTMVSFDIPGNRFLFTLVGLSHFSYLSSRLEVFGQRRGFDS